MNLGVKLRSICGRWSLKRRLPRQHYQIPFFPTGAKEDVAQGELLLAASAVVFQGPEAWPKLKRGGSKLSGPEQLVKVGMEGLRGWWVKVGDLWMLEVGDFFCLEKFREDISEEENGKSSRVDGFFWSFNCIVYQHGRGKAAGLEDWTANNRAKWNRKGEVCSIFWFWVVESKEHLPPLSPTTLGCVRTCTFAAQTQQGGLSDRASWIFNRSVDHSGGSDDESSEQHQSSAWDSFS